MRVELTDGGWADITDASELRNGDRKAINRAIPDIHIDPETQLPVIQANTDEVMRDALLRRVITQWSFTGLPLPRDDMASLDKLSLKDADLLEAAVDEHMKLLKGGQNPAQPGTDPTAG